MVEPLFNIDKISETYDTLSSSLHTQEYIHVYTYMRTRLYKHTYI